MCNYNISGCSVLPFLLLSDTPGTCGWRTELKAWDSRRQGSHGCSSGRTFKVLCSHMSHCHHPPFTREATEMQEAQKLAWGHTPSLFSLGHLAPVHTSNWVAYGREFLRSNDPSSRVSLLEWEDQSSLLTSMIPGNCTSLSGPQFPRVLSRRGRYHIRGK